MNSNVTFKIIIVTILAFNGFFFKCAIEMVGFNDTLSEIKEMNDSQNEPETMSSNRFDITTDSEDIDKV